MVFASVDPQIKQKVLEIYLASQGKKGRNQITKELHEQGIKISHGSVSNFINKYKSQHELEQQQQQFQSQPQQQEQPSSIIEPYLKIILALHLLWPTEMD
jgi:transcription initiation factor TFIID subunit TAF12